MTVARNRIATVRSNVELMTEMIVLYAELLESDHVLLYCNYD